MGRLKCIGWLILIVLLGTTLSAGAQTAPVGKPTVYLFLQAKCPCIYEHKDTFRKILRSFQDQAYIKAVFVGPQDTDASAQELFRHLDWKVDYILDKTHTYVKKYQPEVSTDVVVATPAGKVYYHGAIDDGYKNMGMVEHFYLDAVLRAYLAGKSAPYTGTSGGGCTIMPIP